MKLIDSLKWRYATKKMDANKKVSQENIDNIKEAVQLSASSYGLQPFKVIEIKDEAVRERLKPLCWNQSQITDASNLFIFCNYVNVSDQDVDELLLLKSQINNIPFDTLSGYGEFMKGKLNEKSKDEMFNWTAKQTYIALANAINACAEQKIDSIPMEGFDSDAVNEQLNLSEKGLNACVMLGVGYRHEEDETQHNKKVRKPIDKIFEEI